MEAYDLDLIQVLWVEDDPKIIQSYPIEAESKGLQLEQFSCWDDAKVALEDDYDRWSAIILDAKCKHHRDSADNAVKFLGAALKDIAVISKEKRRVIPWYVLTGGAESEVSDAIMEDREEWDSDWTVIKNRNFYTKSEDRMDLYDRILEHAKKSPRLQVKDMYRDSYKALYVLNKEASEIIIDIFEAMHYPSDHPDFNPVLYYNQLRRILEWNFRNANKYAIIPDVLVNNIVNLNQCCCYLSGKPTLAIKPHLRYGEDDRDRIVPPYIENILFLILNLGNTNSHTTALDEKGKEKLESFFASNVSNSRYLIFSLALQVCEVTLWLCNYIEKHQNIEENKGKCKILDDTEQEKQTEEDGYYEGRIIEVENQHGSFLNVECDLFQFSLQIKSRKGKLKKEDEVLFKVVQEPNKKDPSKQFFFAVDVHLKE